jgi:alkylation response protein AidB-like acyl-CoA dehydrogenase
MDFKDSPEEARYRQHVRQWLDANAPVGCADARNVKFANEDNLEEAKAWQARKADAGFAAITKPTEWGGGGGATLEEVIFSQEELARGLYYGIFTIGVGMCVPTLLAFADEETKGRLVKPTIRGEKIWCQLFSEPSAGSDLAGVRTSAVRDGDDWVVDGQKVWASNAHLADYGILLVRTDPEAPKHKGLTVFWVDMQTSGLESRRLHQMSGLSEFNEVYFDAMRISDSQRVGPVNGGWEVALVTLMNERFTIGGSQGPEWSQILDLACGLKGQKGVMLEDSAFREMIADWYVRAEGVRLSRFRSLTALSRGKQPGPESSAAKLISASQAQDIAAQAMELLDAYGIITDPTLAPIGGGFQQSLMLSPARRIAGGTDEILRNIIAERVLGLPGEIRVDKDLPFRAIPSGGRR